MKIINLTRTSFKVRLKDGTVMDCPAEIGPWDGSISVGILGLASDITGMRIYSTAPIGELPEPEDGTFYVVPKERCLIEGRADLLYLPDPHEFADKDGVFQGLAR